MRYGAQLVAYETRSMEKVAVVIPTLNEERAIGRVLDSIPVAALRSQGYEAVPYVIDGDSHDATRDIATSKGAHLILEPQRGKGSALKTAFTAIDADYVIIVDGDNTYPLESITRMVDMLQTYDVVIGSRLKGVIEQGAMTKLNVVGNTLLTLLAQLLFASDVSDLCTGLWAFRGNVVRSLELVADGFEIEADMFAECALKGFTIAEVPITYRAREGHAKLSSIKDGVRIGGFLLKKYFAHATSSNGHAPVPKPPTVVDHDGLQSPTGEVESAE